MVTRLWLCPRGLSRPVSATRRVLCRDHADVAAVTDSCEHAAMQHTAKHIYGLQFHPEVNHSPTGGTMLKNFVIGVCGCSGDWSMASFVEEAVATIRRTVGETGRVIGAVSGGVDSTVAAVLMNRALGERFNAVLVDNGLLRKDEAANVLKRLRDDCGVNLRCVDASEEFLSRLAGVDDPERKRKIIGNTFIEVFEREAEAIGECDFLLQGTLYPDVIESVSFRGPSATIKSHHNVGGLLDVMKLRLIEPLRELFKDEVRALGMAMGLPRDMVYRHPFPGPGLAVRILGPITKASCDILREADAIYIEELHRSGVYDETGQAFAVLLPCKSVGVMGDCRTYERVLALRAVATSDFMTAKAYRMPYELLEKVSGRIINEVRGINRVVYDCTSKPPGTIEWE
jgi:GMP synthase (glutamine-hydrolysing)